MITTNKVKLTPKDLFLIFVIQHMKKHWWILAGLLVLVFVVWTKGVYDNFGLFIIIFTAFYPFSILFQFWMYVVSKDNKILLLERQYEIDENKIYGIIDGETSPLKIEHFIKVDIIRSTYLLYVAKNLFVFIPMESFESESDRIWFENTIIKKIKNQ